MPTRSSKPRDHDFVTIARSVVDRTIGEKMDGTPLDDPNRGNEILQTGKIQLHSAFLCDRVGPEEKPPEQSRRSVLDFEIRRKAS